MEPRLQQFQKKEKARIYWEKIADTLTTRLHQTKDYISQVDNKHHYIRNTLTAALVGTVLIAGKIGIERYMYQATTPERNAAEQARRTSDAKIAQERQRLYEIVTNTAVNPQYTHKR